MQDPTRATRLVDLPKEVLIVVSTHLDYGDAYSVALVARRLCYAFAPAYRAERRYANDPGQALSAGAPLQVARRLLARAPRFLLCGMLPRAARGGQLDVVKWLCRRMGRFDLFDDDDNDDDQHSDGENEHDDSTEGQGPSKQMRKRPLSGAKTAAAARKRQRIVKTYSPCPVGIAAGKSGSAQVFAFLGRHAARGTCCGEHHRHACTKAAIDAASRGDTTTVLAYHAMMLAEADAMHQNACLCDSEIVDAAVRVRQTETLRAILELDCAMARYLRHDKTPWLVACANDNAWAIECLLACLGPADTLADRTHEWIAESARQGYIQVLITAAEQGRAFVPHLRAAVVHAARAGRMLELAWLAGDIDGWELFDMLWGPGQTPLPPQGVWCARLAARGVLAGGQQCRDVLHWLVKRADGRAAFDLGFLRRALRLGNAEPVLAMHKIGLIPLGDWDALALAAKLRHSDALDALLDAGAPVTSRALTTALAHRRGDAALKLIKRSDSALIQSAIDDLVNTSRLRSIDLYLLVQLAPSVCLVKVALAQWADAVSASSNAVHAAFHCQCAACLTAPSLPPHANDPTSTAAIESI